MTIEALTVGSPRLAPPFMPGPLPWSMPAAWRTAVRRLMVLTSLVLPVPLQAQDAALPALERPVPVTDSAIARGERLFHGSASCSACHGVAGTGTDSAPALAQGVWMHGPDSFEGILTRVLHGVPKAYSTRGVTMPMRGWTTMDDDQARDVAAYVWHISHGARPRPVRPPS